MPRIRLQVRNANLIKISQGDVMMKHCIGVDVSKLYLDIDWLGKAQRKNNGSKDIDNLITKLKKLQTEKKLSLVICEASGGYEKKLVQACHQSNIPIHVAHANKIRAFAKSQGILAKTDKIDACVLSQYGRLMHPEADQVLLSKNAEKIRGLLLRRNQLLKQKMMEQNRLDAIEDPIIKSSLNRHIIWLNDELEIVESELGKLQLAEDINADHQLLTSIRGIGDTTANYLIAFLPELGQISHKAVAALVGIAPFNRDSGNQRGKRFIQGGRAKLRHVIYMAAIASTRWNPDLKKFYERLRAAGKPAKVAMIAVARKLLSMANSVLCRKTPWQEKYEKLA